MAGRVDEACERSHVRRRETLMRTAKSCGPDAPTLASSLRRHVGPTGFWHAISADNGGKQARSPGRARNKPLKPLRRECRVFRWTCGDYTRVLPTHCTRGCGCTAHPAFPAPSVFEGEWLCARLRRFAPRDANACVDLAHRHCERSEAIHSFFLAALWIASLRSQ